ncbi:putative fmi1 protein [Daldinia childiae]|uniref:putative fmi1 protein n=1 Tax=Daldinia childiae TaxID=326645 RepID=UPI001448482B|nr:putative fmi1 protein [Daldinia childiae]KAF3056635.1 putative fmi1 protein [Daldinia childiae]
MSLSLTIRCAGRTIPRLLPGPQTLRLRPLQQASPRGWPLSKTPYFPHGRHFSSLPPGQSNEAQVPPTNEPQTAQQQQQQPPPPKQRPTWRTWVLFNLAGLSGVFIVAVVLRSINSQDGAKNSPINTTSFSPFTITAKEQVSPTAFVLSVRAEQQKLGQNGESSSQLLQRSWDHGLWSVEIKQPQLQIARHYTPLPPLSGSCGNAEGEGGGELRFLIRKVDGGEMSTYLSKLRVGEKIWLRGPHLGFDVARRLGDAGRHVVFLAGGTGIAPALQVARRVLEDYGSGVEISGQEGKRKPTVSILWANRYAADALGRQQQQQTRGSNTNNLRSSSSWFWRSATPTPAPSGTINQDLQTQAEPTLALQIRELQLKHPDHFHISYFIDEERHFIEEQDLHLALTNTSSLTSIPLPASPSCTWHSPTQLITLPDDNDVERRTSPCTCLHNNPSSSSSTQTGAGANLICVSGPYGFVAAYAGAKRWFGGSERQGPVRGMLGQMMQDEGRNWLVLKL